jgi:hypothetical protein
MKKQWLAVLILALSLPAYGYRVLPKDAKAGKVKAYNPPLLKIDTTQYRLAPGVRIYDQNNRLIFPYSIPVDAAVYFRLDMRGELAQIWLLTGQEILNKPIQR